MTDTSKEAVERLANAMEIATIRYADLTGTFMTLDQPGMRAAATLRQLRTDLTAANEKLASAREALEIVAGKRQCLDNLMGNIDVAEAALKILDTTTPASHEGQCDHSWHLYQPNGFSAVKERCGKCWEIRSIAEAFTAKESQS